MRNIFISYAHQDSPKVQELLSQLQGVQISGFNDSADIASGQEISSVLRNSIKKANALLVLVSPASLKNCWVEFEVSAGQALGKKIIPIIISGEGIEDELPPSISDIVYIDARKKSLDKVISEIKRVATI
ncbi:MAG: toll/interleukin-1 receptor domain-containing protein [Xenococcus sp. (in: cyanobacteria)]